jgi:hypothetical protein
MRLGCRLFALLGIAAACGSGGAPTAETVSGRALIKGQTDNSGIFVFISGSMVSESSRVTDASGTWSFQAGANTRAFVSAYAPSTKESLLETYANVAPGPSTTVPDFVFTPVGSFAGSVTVTSGTAEGAVVAVEGTDLAATTDATGAYSIDAVPAGTYTLHATLAGHMPVSLANQAVTYKATTTVPPIGL